jgi:hypothetical protein
LPVIGKIRSRRLLADVAKSFLRIPDRSDDGAVLEENAPNNAAAAIGGLNQRYSFSPSSSTALRSQPCPLL